MASVEETEKLGNGLSLIEAYNLLLNKERFDSWNNRVRIMMKIQKVINLMDEVLC